MRKPIFILIAAILFAFITDQWSKLYVVHTLKLTPGELVPVIEPYYNMRYLLNYGINFGFFGDGTELSRWVVTAITSAIAIGALWWVRRHMTTASALFIGLLVGGATGNIWDRIYNGAVIDFINNSCCGFNNPFSYNVADIWIFAGIIGIWIWGPRDA